MELDADTRLGWQFMPLGKTPSAELGMEPAKEARYRREGADFIKNLALKLYGGPTRVGNVHLTGIVFYHRFYTTYSFTAYPRWYMAAACLFVAGKVEEQPKKLKDLLPVFYEMYPRKRTNGEPAVVPPLDNPSKQFNDLKVKILANERILLQTLKFDMLLKHPPMHLFKFAHGLKLPSGETLQCPAGKKMIQQAFKYIGDSYKTVLCLEYQPEVVAVAALDLAARVSKLTVIPLKCDKTNPQVGQWWEYFDKVKTTPEHHIKAVTAKIIAFYETTGASFFDPGPNTNSPLGPATPSSTASPAGGGHSSSRHMHSGSSSRASASRTNSGQGGQSPSALGRHSQGTSGPAMHDSSMHGPQASSRHQPYKKR